MEEREQPQTLSTTRSPFPAVPLPGAKEHLSFPLIGRPSSHRLDRALTFVSVSLLHFCPPDRYIAKDADTRDHLPAVLQLAKDGHGSAVFQGLADIYTRLVSINDAVREDERAKGIRREY